MRLTIAIPTLVLAAACAGVPESDSAEYAFFVAGHAYGKPGKQEVGMFPPFVRALPWLADDMGVDFGVLTGDVVAIPTRASWDAVDAELAPSGLEVLIAPGNHDLGPRMQEQAGDERVNPTDWAERYGPTYRAKRRGEDLLIVLDGNLDGWRISGEQLAFLDRVLDDGRDARNLFVFVHQVIWWSEERPEGRVRLNSGEGRADELNFWSDVAPRLESVGCPVYLFAGDVGAGSWTDDLRYDVVGDLHLIASGMGDGKRDHLVLVHVDREGQVELERIDLEGGGEAPARSVLTAPVGAR